MAKRKTHNEFVNELNAVNKNIKILEDYKGSTVKIKCLCKIDNYEWNAVPFNLLKGTGCPKCAGNITKTHDEFINEINFINPNILILDKYKNSKTSIKCKCRIDGHEWMSTPDNLISKKSGCPKCAGNQSYSHDLFVEKMSLINSNIKITGIYTRNSSKVECSCLVCSNIWHSTANNLLRGRGCPVCSGKRVLKGVNDISTTDPELVKYFKNEDDAYNHSRGSDKKAFFKCINCNHEKEMNISTFVSQGFARNVCSDSISYPEKLMINLLTHIKTQYGITIETQKTFEWSSGKRYDFYIPEYYTIIETHGEQHYKEKSGMFNNRTLKQEQENDDIKKSIALLNGIKKYIVVNCSKSNHGYLKDSILKSELNTLFDLTNVDWNEIFKMCENSIFFKCCYEWNNGMQLKDIATANNISICSVRSNLNKGTDLGLCNYNGRENDMILKSHKVWLVNENSILEFKSKSDMNRATGIKVETAGKATAEKDHIITANNSKYKGWTITVNNPFESF